MKNPLIKWLFMLSYLIASLAAINVGLLPFGYNFFQSDFVVLNLFRFIPLFHYIILAAGLILLTGFIMCASGNHTHCNSCKDKHCK
jgi:hypothetical protein